MIMLLCNSFSPWLCTLITRNTVYRILSVLKNLQWGYQNLQKIVLCFVQIIWNENFHGERLFHGAYEVKYRDTKIGTMKILSIFDRLFQYLVWSVL